MQFSGSVWQMRCFQETLRIPCFSRLGLGAGGTECDFKLILQISAQSLRKYQSENTQTLKEKWNTVAHLRKVVWKNALTRLQSLLPSLSTERLGWAGHAQQRLKPKVPGSIPDAIKWFYSVLFFIAKCGLNLQVAHPFKFQSSASIEQRK